MAQNRITGTFTAVASGAQIEDILLSDMYQQYKVTSGTISYTAADSLTIRINGTPVHGMVLEIEFDCDITLANSANAKIQTSGAFSFSIKGDDSGTLPALYANKKFTLYAKYTGSSWSYQCFPSVDETGIITGAMIASDADLTPGKLALAEGSIIVGNSSTVGAALDAKTSGQILVGNGTTVTSVAVSGDITITSAGVVAIAAGAIVNADINASAAIAFSKLATLSSGNILVGSAGNVATSVAMSGDVTIDNTGATTIGASVVENSMMADDSVSLSNLDSTGQIESYTTSQGTPASTTETTLATFTLPTGSIDADGETLEVYASGTTAANANNKTLRLKIGTTTIATNGTTTAPNNLNWIIRGKIFRTGAAAQKGSVEIIFNGVATEIDYFTATETWSGNTISITGQNGSASANDIVLETFEIINNKENNN